jgi:DNA segregation ATPase FtsK/SpoIIIE-like protein
MLIEVPSPDARTPTALALARATRGLVMAIGLDQFRRPATIDLRHHPTILFVGPTRSGKSEGMRSALYALAARNGPALLQFVIFSQKRESWDAFAGAAACWGVVSDPAESAAAMTWLARSMLLDRARRRVKEPAIVVVLDDLLNLLQEAPQVADAVGAIASLGGGLGVFQIIGTQDAGSKHGTGGPRVEANVTARVIYRPATRTEGARASGTTAEGLEQLSGRKGDALMSVGGHCLRVATGYADDRLIVQLPQGKCVVAPWRTMTSELVLPEPPEPVPPHSPFQAADEATEGGETARTGSELVPEPDAEPVEPAPEPVPALRPEPLVLPESGTGLFPIRPPRFPNAREAAEIRRLHADGWSLNRLCLLVYEHKNGQTYAWIKVVVESVLIAPATNGNGRH